MTSTQSKLLEQLLIAIIVKSSSDPTCISEINEILASNRVPYNPDLIIVLKDISESDKDNHLLNYYSRAVIRQSYNELVLNTLAKLSSQVVSTSETSSKHITDNLNNPEFERLVLED